MPETEPAKNVHPTPGKSLGKRPPLDRKAVSLSEFLRVLPVVPPTSDPPPWNYPMQGNDIAGNCVVVGWDHSRQVIVGLLRGTQRNYTMDEIWAFYRTQNPRFDPHGSSSTNGPGSSADQGMNIQLFLEYLVTNKYILGFGKINFRDEAEMKAAAYLGLSIVTGVLVRTPQLNQQYDAGLWDATGGAAEGGHCINLVGYNTPPGSFWCVTWGKLVNCTKKFIAQQMDEAWFLLTQDHVDNPTFRSGFDLNGFADAVYNITNGKVVVPINIDPPHYMFTRTLKFRMSGADVMELQKRLSKEKALDGGMCYRYKENNQLYFGTYFGLNTMYAVQRYQAIKKIVSSGTPETTGYGQVGPKTLATLNGTEFKVSLVDAMIQVESGGNDNAVGDLNLTDHAYGCLQIRQGVMDQYNTYKGTSYKSSKCLGNRALSLDVFSTYWKIFPQMDTNEERAKAWNGGPGYKQFYGKAGYEQYTKNLDSYWGRVQKALQGLPAGIAQSEIKDPKTAWYPLQD